jgi:hypothetical protein
MLQNHAGRAAPADHGGVPTALRMSGTPACREPERARPPGPDSQTPSFLTSASKHVNYTISATTPCRTVIQS